jgi:hypothetical protein
MLRAALADSRVDAVVAISMFPGAMTAQAPDRLLMVSGA